MKPNNILVFNNGDSDFQFKLADLGISHFRTRTQKEQLSARNGTRTYGSETLQPDCGISGLTLILGAPEAYRPESFENNQPSSKDRSDIWSLGCIFSETLRWTVDGYDGLLKYRQDRMSAVERIYGHRDSDCFHNGERVLKTVIEFHSQVKERTPRSDLLTRKILDITTDMLEVSSARPDSQNLRRKLPIILREAKEELEALESKGAPPSPPSSPPPSPQIRPTTVADYDSSSQAQTQSNINKWPDHKPTQSLELPQEGPGNRESLSEMEDVTRSNAITRPQTALFPLREQVFEIGNESHVGRQPEQVSVRRGLQGQHSMARTLDTVEKGIYRVETLQPHITPRGFPINRTIASNNSILVNELGSTSVARRTPFLSVESVLKWKKEGKISKTRGRIPDSHYLDRIMTRDHVRCLHYALFLGRGLLIAY